MSLELGLQSTFIRGIGTIPGPLIVGALFDASCMHWQDTCGDRGNCWVYNKEDLSLKIFGVTIGIRIVAILLAFCTWKFYNVTPCKNCGQVTRDRNEGVCMKANTT